jgi:general secretion pathway protein M
MVAEINRDRILAVALLLGAVLLVYLVGFHWWFVRGHLDISREMADLREQAARFAATIAQRPAVEAQLARVREFEANNPAFLAEANFDAASAALITRLRRAVEAHARDPQTCQLLSNQPVRTRDPERYLRVTINVRMRCDIEDFAAVVHDLENGSPVLFLDNLTIDSRRFGRVPGRAQRVQDYTEQRFTVFGYVRQRGIADGG